jgi:K+-sensing histidine kinase KdpD
VCSFASDILDYSKIDAGLLQLDLVPTPLLEALETAVMLCEDAAASSGLDLLYQVQSEACATFAIDATRLQQILLNLLSNVRSDSQRWRPCSAAHKRASAFADTASVSMSLPLPVAFS